MAENIDAIYTRWRNRPFALDQSTHAAINARHSPGTRQTCSRCDAETGFCEEDGYRDDDGRPLCEPCAQEPRRG